MRAIGRRRLARPKWLYARSTAELLDPAVHTSRRSPRLTPGSFYIRPAYIGQLTCKLRSLVATSGPTLDRRSARAGSTRRIGHRAPSDRAILSSEHHAKEWISACSTYARPPLGLPISSRVQSLT